MHDDILDLIGSSWKTQAVVVAAELDLPQRLATAKSARSLAEELCVDASALERLLRSLVALGLFSGDEVYQVTDLGVQLGHLRNWAIWWGRYNWRVWERLDYSIRTGQSARAMLEGSGFGKVEEDPEVAAIFNAAMSELSSLSAGVIAGTYDFGRFGSIVDVGGGTGVLAKEIAERYPNASVTVFDREHARVPGVLFEAGDFFERVPPGADLYIVKSVLHDWKDADCVRILSTIRHAMPSHGSLLVIERILPEVYGYSQQDLDAARGDLHMLLAHGSKERSLSEWESLLSAARFAQPKITGATMGLSLLEAQPV